MANQQTTQAHLTIGTTGKRGLRAILPGLLVTISLMMLLNVNAHLVQANTNLIYCVVPSDDLLTPYPVCNQVFNSVQAAVDASPSGQEIRVATGYYPGVSERNGLYQSVYINKSVTIRGGYIIPFTNEPDPTSYPTQLDAQGLGRVFHIGNDFPEQYLWPFNVTIEGLEISGGNATNQGGTGGGINVQNATVTLDHNLIQNNVASTEGDGDGGGIYANNSQITINRNTVINNIAAISTTKGSRGGGIALDNSIFTISHNQILSNTARISDPKTDGGNYSAFGGGIAINSNSNSQVGSSLILANIIRANVASETGNGSGGGIYMNTDMPLTISQNLIQKNIGAREGTFDNLGGGITLMNYANVLVEKNVIEYNQAAVSSYSSAGGGIFAYTEGLSTSTITITHNLVRGNIGLGQGDYSAGGGMFLNFYNSSAYLTNNTVINNIALISETQLSDLDRPGGFGGGIFVRGARQDSSTVQLNGDLLQNNIASQSSHGWGGGLYMQQGRMQTTNLAIIDNHASTAGSGIMVGGEVDVTLNHATVARNQGGNGSGLSMSDWTLKTYINGPSIITVTNLIVSNQSIGLNAEGDTTATIHGVLWHQTPITVTTSPTATTTVMNEYNGDPAFTADGFHISSDSLAINQGIPAGVLVDFDGQPRQDAPDLGADEYSPPSHEGFLPVVGR